MIESSPEESKEGVEVIQEKKKSELKVRLIPVPEFEPPNILEYVGFTQLKETQHTSSELSIVTQKSFLN